MHIGYSRHSLLGLLLTIAAIFMGLSPRPAQGYDVTHPNNLLAFTGTNSSSGEHSQAVDNLIGDSTGDNGLLFGPGDDQILAISGFNNAIAVIRYYTLTSEGIRFPDGVSIKSSINPTVSVIATDYESDLGTFSWVATDFTMVPATGRGGDGYIDLYVSAPPGTLSLYFDFEGGSAGARVSEVQAFAFDPVIVCVGDFDSDRDVDGNDLSVFAADFGRTDCDTGPVCEGNFDNDNDVDESDLADYAAEFGRTDCDFPVYFPDPNLDAAIRGAISKPTGVIRHSDLQDLTTLDANFRGIVELEGLQYCTNLSWVDLGYNQITDISALAGLVNLSSLQLNSNQITDISALAGLVNLSSLDLSNNLIIDISALADLVDLSELLIAFNHIIDISALAGLVNLSTLDLHVNSIIDISALAGLVNLSSLLHLENNSITDISALVGLTNLSQLLLYDNNITDISPLVSNLGIGDGDRITLDGNPLDSTSCTVHIPELISRGATVTYPNHCD